MPEAVRIRNRALQVALLAMLAMAVFSCLVDVGCALLGDPGCHDCVSELPGDCATHSSPAAPATVVAAAPPLAALVLEATPAEPRLQPHEAPPDLAPSSAPPPRAAGRRAPPA